MSSINTSLICAYMPNDMCSMAHSTVYATQVCLFCKKREFFAERELSFSKEDLTSIESPNGCLPIHNMSRSILSLPCVCHDSFMCVPRSNCTSIMNRLCV